MLRDLLPQLPRRLGLCGQQPEDVHQGAAGGGTGGCQASSKRGGEAAAKGYAISPMATIHSTLPAAGERLPASFAHMLPLSPSLPAPAVRGGRCARGMPADHSGMIRRQQVRLFCEQRVLNHSLLSATAHCNFMPCSQEPHWESEEEIGKKPCALQRLRDQTHFVASSGDKGGAKGAAGQPSRGCFPPAAGRQQCMQASCHAADLGGWVCVINKAAKQNRLDCTAA